MLLAKLSDAVYCYRTCLRVYLQWAGGVRTLLQPACAQCLRLSERFFHFVVVVVVVVIGVLVVMCLRSVSCVSVGT